VLTKSLEIVLAKFCKVSQQQLKYFRTAKMAKFGIFGKIPDEICIF